MRSLFLFGFLICLNSASAQPWFTVGNTSTGVEFLGFNNNFGLPVVTNSAQRMFVAAGAGPNAGFVGIGNNFSSPLQRLHVVGDINLETDIFSRTATNDGYRINNQTVLQVKNSQNLFVGWGAGAGWVNAAGAVANTFVGENSGFTNTSGDRNTFMGFESGRDNSTASFNTYIGYQAGLVNTTGFRNSYLGNFAGLNNTTGNNNTFIGDQSGSGNLTGSFNTYVGTQTDHFSVAGSGDENSFLGHDAGHDIQDGSENTLVGSHAGQLITDGNRNFLGGTRAGFNITNGSNNAIIGFQASNAITTGSNNVVMGFQTAFNLGAASSNVILGIQSGFVLNNGNNNIFFGNRAGRNFNNGSNNIFSGTGVAFNWLTGNNNIASGTLAGQNKTAGNNNIFQGTLSGRNATTGNNNVYMGNRSGEFSTTGNNNVFVGTRSGRATSGNRNTYVGFESGSDGTASNLNNSAGIGSQAIPTGNNEMILGDNNVNVGIGLSNDANGPNNKLEIETGNTDLTPNPGGGTGFSGLRFRDLTAVSTPYTTNPGSGVLAVDSLGDVIYVPSGTAATPFGAACPDIAGVGDLAADHKVGMNDFRIYYADGPNPATPGVNQFGVGYDCAQPMPGKVSVNNVSEQNGTYTQTIATAQTGAFGNPVTGLTSVLRNNSPGGAGTFASIFALSQNNGTTQTGIWTDVTGSQTNVGVVSSAGVFGTINTSNTAGRFSAVGGTGANIGLGAASFGENGSQNFGVQGSATGAGSNVNYGVQGTAGGNVGSTNYGVWGSAVASADSYAIYGQNSGSGGGGDWAGFFVGDVFATGSITSGSDQNLKENITNLDLDSASFYINSLDPKTFNFQIGNYPHLNLADGHQYGLIAQDVETVLPGFVTEVNHPAQYDSLGNQISPAEDFKGLDYQAFIPLIIADAQNKNESIDSLNNIIDTQDSLLTDLNDRLTLLENCLSGVLNTLCQMSNSSIQQNPEDVQNKLAEVLNVELTDARAIILDQNVPNPFAEQTVISYTIPETVRSAQMLFYNEAGQLIKKVDIPERGLGQINVYGQDLSAGIYSYSLVADGQIVSTKRMVKTEN